MRFRARVCAHAHSVVSRNKACMHSCVDYFQLCQFDNDISNYFRRFLIFLLKKNICVYIVMSVVERKKEETRYF